MSFRCRSTCLFNCFLVVRFVVCMFSIWEKDAFICSPARSAVRRHAMSLRTADNSERQVLLSSGKLVLVFAPFGAQLHESKSHETIAKLIRKLMEKLPHYLFLFRSAPRHRSRGAVLGGPLLGISRNNVTHSSCGGASLPSYFLFLRSLTAARSGGKAAAPFKKVYGTRWKLLTTFLKDWSEFSLRGQFSFIHIHM